MPKPVYCESAKKHFINATKAAENEVERRMQAAAARLAPNNAANYKNNNASVSFDRSFRDSAACGYGAVVSVLTGTFLDYHVASKVGKQCSLSLQGDRVRGLEAVHQPAAIDCDNRPMRKVDVFDHLGCSNCHLVRNIYVVRSFVHG